MAVVEIEYKSDFFETEYPKDILDVKRGDIFWVESVKNSPDGGIIDNSKKYRPAIVISNNVGNSHGSILEIVYCTTKQDYRYLPTHVTVSIRGRISTVLCEQITTIHKSRLSDKIRTLTSEEMAKIDKALKASIALDDDIDFLGDERLQNENKALKEKVKALEEELKKEKENVDDHIMFALTCAEAERDMVKTMYDKLLCMVLEKK